jgi:seryl-tRNA synthetase
MKIMPTWPIAVGTLVAGLAIGAGADHLWMNGKVSAAQKRYTDLSDEVKAERHQREVQRGNDERAARAREQALVARAGQIEQEKENEIAQVRSTADALIDRLRKQAASKPSGTGGVREASATCPAQPRPDIPLGSGERIVRIAERADAIRAGLAACYKWADSVGAAGQAAEDPQPAADTDARASNGD